MIRRLLVANVLVATAAFADGPLEPRDLSDEEAAAAGLTAIVRGEKSIVTQPQSIGVLDRAGVKRNEGIFLDDTINLIPGVRFESRTVAGGQRITIRGYGNATNFNGMGYKAYLNGIPLTDAEGATILDDLDVSMLSRVEVIKGPASSLYGSGIGGVVLFSTLAPERGATALTQELIGGSTKLFRSNTRVETASESWSFLANYGHQHSDGYRIHSLSNKDFAMLSGDYRPSSKQQVSYLASYAHSFDQLAGQLTDEQFNARQNVAEALYLANNGHVAIDSLRFGVSNKFQFVPLLGNTTSAFASGYQLNQPFAVGLSDNLVLNAGARTQFEGRTEVGFGRLTATIGSEIERSAAFKKSYGLVNGAVGGLRGDLQVTSVQSNTFAQATALLPADASLTAGASLNVVRYAITDRLANSSNPTHLSQSGNKTFDPVITPRIALEKSFGPGLSVYGQLSEGYSAPGSGSVVIPQIGAVNKDLKPERGTLFEVGSKASFLDDRLSYELALFDLRVDNKLTPQSISSPNGTVLYTITTNAGSQTNIGLEAALKYALIKDTAGAIQLVRAFAGYTYSHFRYSNFMSDNNGNAGTVNYDGKKVVGVPDHMFDAGLDVASKWGVYGNATLLTLGSMPLTYDNQHSAKGYGLLDAKIGYRRALPAGFRLDLSFGAKNITNSTYYTMAFLNSTYPPGGPQPNVYLPGPGATVHGGVDVRKAF